MKYRTSSILCKTALIASTISLLGCGATAAKYEPITDGAPNQNYQSDLGACQRVSEKRPYFNDDVKTAALVGAAIGAVAGGDVIGGAAVGGTLGTAGRAWETRDERKNIIVECMRGRGHSVVG